MQFKYKSNNPNFYATNLRANEGKLKWDTNNGGMTLIIKSRFGEDIIENIEKICEELNRQGNIVRDRFYTIDSQISVRFVDTVERIKNGGCSINANVSRYTVLACRLEEDNCVIFEPLKRYTVDIPAEVKVSGAKVYDRVEKGFLRKKVEEIFSGYYEVQIEMDTSSSYEDGDIYYLISEDDLGIPVTEKMIEVENFYIQTDKMPVFKTEKKGFHISIEDIQ